MLSHPRTELARGSQTASKLPSWCDHSKACVRPKALRSSVAIGCASFCEVVSTSSPTPFPFHRNEVSLGLSEFRAARYVLDTALDCRLVSAARVPNEYVPVVLSATDLFARRAGTRARGIDDAVIETSATPFEEELIGSWSALRTSCAIR